MKVFVASLATETNTFSPVPTDRASFLAAFYAPPGAHPVTPTLCSAIFTVLRDRARLEEFELIEGTAAWAEPGGLVQRQTYEVLRDEILDQLREVLPVHAVVLGLHGAMVAQGYDDCEGDLVARVRTLVGPDVVIGATFDPHSHLTPKRVKNLNVLNAFLEFPHTDFVARAEQVVDIVMRAARGEISPVISVFDCRMIDVLPTSQQPMRGFVDDLRALEGHDGVLSASLIHGFLAGDVPELGARLVIVTDDNPALGERLAREKGMALFALRGTTRMTQHSIGEALELAGACVRAGATKPIVLADTWDNPGGGVAGDGTLILQAMLAAGIDDTAVATIWDPIAVTFCLAAGEGARIHLRFGGKSGPGAGDPVDAEVIVLKAVEEAWESFGASKVPLGPVAVIRIIDTRTDVILNTNRTQTFDPDIFSGLGIDITTKKYLVVKSTNHFYAAFKPVAAEILYVDAGTHYPSDARRTRYTKLTRPLWPIVEDPHGLK
ncbi:M81 family metallopeptidase [Acetobacter fallax]|uniref:Microcystinase C n=1 Tax=Acetobacter fallax TaxID=1737473 RepID=A0ABX0KH97_9PROT|nr:M81 family metallopeptidase [Acetobacter fallax]NHO33287.1 microcystin LR degradation protein MlrC-like protein [Acetobacter fallax]NHO36908.1 microcystin LR degradation protein MlrC-like protein [Acetobacter fallax]